MNKNFHTRDFHIFNCIFFFDEKIKKVNCKEIKDLQYEQVCKTLIKVRKIIRVLNFRFILYTDAIL